MYPPCRGVGTGVCLLYLAQGARVIVLKDVNVAEIAIRSRVGRRLASRLFVSPRLKIAPFAMGATGRDSMPYPRNG